MRLNAMVVGGLFAGMLAGTAPATAQIGVGVFGGVSFADLHGSEKDDFAPGRSGRTGFLAGAMLDIPLGIISIRPEVFYVQKGVQFSDPTFAAEFDLDYIEIPVLLVVGIPAGGLKVEFFAGPQVAFRTKCDISFTDTGGTEQSLPCDDAVTGAELESTDFGVIVGGGVTISNFMVQAAFDYGLATVDAESDPFDIKTQAIYITAGWMFRLP